MQLIMLHSGMSGGVILFQLWPPFFEICSSPSSDPAHNTPGSCADSAKANTVAYVSAPIASRLTGPPVGLSVSGSARVRSGLIGCQLWPSLVLLNTKLATMDRPFACCVEITIGYVHAKRYLSSLAP